MKIACSTCPARLMVVDVDADGRCPACRKPTHFAAVGEDEDGRAVVWGIGAAKREAFREAVYWMVMHGCAEAEIFALRVHPINAEQRDVIAAGDNAWPVTLGAGS